jgi:uncharacterized membrane protein
LFDRPHVAATNGEEVFMGGAVLMLAMASLAGLVLLVLALIDLARHPAPVWDEAGQNQLVWAIVVIFVGFIGPVLYLLMARPGLDAAAARLDRVTVGQ